MMNIRSRKGFVEAADVTVRNNHVSGSLVQTFSLTVSQKRDFILRWIHGKYSSLPMSDVADIAQEACIDLWTWCNEKEIWKISSSDFVNLWKAFCRNKLSHFMQRVSHHHVAFDEEKHDKEEECPDTDFILVKREMFYAYLDTMKESDRKLILMYIEGYSTKDICKALGYKNKAVLKNVKCRLIRKMHNDILHSEQWKAYTASAV